MGAGGKFCITYLVNNLRVGSLAVSANGDLLKTVRAREPIAKLLLERLELNLPVLLDPSQLTETSRATT